MKKLVSMLATMFAVCLAQADDDLLMYWMIDQSEADPRTAFSYAMIAIDGEGVDQGVYLTTDGYQFYLPAATDPLTGLGMTTEAAYSSLAYLAGTYDLSTLSFAVELYDTSGALVGLSTAVSYNELLQNHHLYHDMWTSGAMPYVFTAAVPEPSGGMLFLIGFGVLALRRKRS